MAGYILTIALLAICLQAVLCQNGTAPTNSTNNAPVGLTPEQYKKLEVAVHNIVGPGIKPDETLIQLAIKQGAAPTGFDQLMEYVVLMQQMARKIGIKVPGVMGKATGDQIDNFILENAIGWHQRKSAMASSAVPGAMMPEPSMNNNIGYNSNNLIDTNMLFSNEMGLQTGGANQPSTNTAMGAQPGGTVQQSANQMQGTNTGMTGANNQNQEMDFFTLMAMSNALGMENMFRI